MSIDNGQKALSSLFADNILSVPQFQRAYAWEREPHLRNFIEDLRNHPNDQDKKYFFGTILLTEDKTIKTPLFTGYEIVDGQQRLTTVSIFVAAAIPILRADPSLKNNADDYQERFISKRNVRKFHTIDEDEGFLERFIVGDEFGNERNCVTPSQRRLLDAKQYFTETFAKEKNTSEIDRLIRTLWESQILVYAVNSNAEATQIFELQNDRGKRLTDLEALKSFLMHGLYLHAGDGTENDLKIVQSNFATIYRAVERLEGKYAAPDEDQILSFHCIAFEESVTLEDGANGWARPKQLVRHLLLEQSTKLAKAKWIKNFSHRLRDSYESVLEILEARDCLKCIPMGDLAVLGRTATFWPLLLKCWKLDTNKRTAFSDAVRAMVDFTFRAIIAGKRADVGVAELRQLARDFGGDFKSLIDHLADMRKWWEIPIYFPLGLNAENFFDWGTVATYLLWRYENYLRAQIGRQAPRLQWDTIVAPANHAVKYEKDHIEPKDPSNPNLTRRVKWNHEDAEARPFSEVFLHRLGNLVLDTYSTGSAKGSGDFVSRIPHYTNSTFLSQSEIVSRFASKDANGMLIWDEAAIQRRHAALVDFAKNHM